MTTFLATLSPLLTLFFCMAVGFAANKTKILPDSTGKVLAKLENWVFVPALCFVTMISHTLCVLTIPLLYTLMVSLFGVPFGG